MKRILRPLIVFIAVLSLNCVFAESLKFRINKKTISQGEILKIQQISKNAAPFTVEFLDRKYQSVLTGAYQTVLAGIDYQLTPGIYVLTAVYQVQPNYYTHHNWKIGVKEKFPNLKYNPPERGKEERKQIDSEAEKLQQALAEANYVIQKLKKFVWPIKPVKINAGFGDRRCRDRIGRKKFNCRYHLGTDFRAAFDKDHSNPAAVSAIGDGKIILTENHLMNGKIIVIDHGNGISSGYLHLSKFLVKEGDRITAGQKIGVAGKTGATEAIHLHLFIKMDYGKTTVDPEKFLKLLSK